MRCKVLFLMLVTALWPIRANELSGRTPIVDSVPSAPERLESGPRGDASEVSEELRTHAKKGRGPLGTLPFLLKTRYFVIRQNVGNRVGYHKLIVCSNTIIF